MCFLLYGTCSIRRKLNLSSLVEYNGILTNRGCNSYNGIMLKKVSKTDWDIGNWESMFWRKW